MKECLIDVQNAVVNMDDDIILDLVKKCLEEGLSAIEIIEEGLSKGLEGVGERFDAGEYFLAELIMAGEVVTVATDFLQTKMAAGEAGKKGKVLIATVKGDIHEIGKNILGMILKASGYEIIDLGADVSAEKILETVKEQNIQLVGLSVLLTTMVGSIKEVVDLLTAAGLREKTRIAIGGACCSLRLAEEMKVDAFGESAVQAVGIFDGFREALAAS